jgi:hypothetical protein
MIRDCADIKEACLEAEADGVKGCIPEFSSCAADCVGEAEDAIRNML